MRSFFSMLLAGAICWSCSNNRPAPSAPRDGFYEVIRLGSATLPAQSLQAGEIVIPFDTLFDRGIYTQLVIDTTDYVPLELDTALSKSQAAHKNPLSITFSGGAAKKIKPFTAKRIMKQAVIVLDGKAISMHKIRDTIAGPGMEITRCDNTACE